MLSVILYGRNDNYGYNLHKRAAVSLNCLAHVLTDPDDEIIFVDCNTPDDLPTFPEAIQDTLTSHAKQRLRILRLRPALFERCRRHSHLSALEPQSRNLAIRRTNPANRWILSTNTDMIFVPRRAGSSLSDIVANLSDGFYELPRFELPETLWESLNRSDPEAIIAACARWGQTLHLNEVITSTTDIRYDGPGDFQLMLREQIFAIQGFNEEMVWGWHVDSNLCRRMYLYNGRTGSLIDHLFGYHCDHTRQATLAHGPNRVANDLGRFYFRVISPFLPEQAETWGMPDEPIEEIRLAQPHSRRLDRAIECLIPAQAAPYTERAYTRDWYNEPLFYDNAHVLPFVADHLVNFPPSADVGYLGANPVLLDLLGRFRDACGHSGRILYDPQLLQHAGSGHHLSSSCTAAPEAEIFERAVSFIFDAGLSSVKTASTADQPGGNFTSEAVAFSQALQKSFLVFAQAERDRLLSSKAAPRKFLLIAGQSTWFEQVTANVIATTATPFSTCVRHGYVRIDAQFPRGVELERGARGIQRRVRDPNVPASGFAPVHRSISRPIKLLPNRAPARVRWQAPFFSASPLADESRYLVLHLQEQGMPVAARVIGIGDPAFQNQLPQPLGEAVQRALKRSLDQRIIDIMDAPAAAFQRASDAAYVIGRTTCEAESLPTAWAVRCNDMDEIWVPSEFQHQALRAAGVQVPIFTIANGVDVDHFRPGQQPAYFRGLRGVVFLFLGEWAYHQGWDVLLRAWAQAFGPDDEVSLLIHAHLLGASAIDDEAAEIDNRIDHFLREELGCSRADVAPIVVARNYVPYACLPNLLAAAHVLVAPARGGGWGHWRMAAMASGLPVIGTRWGAPLDYMNDDNSLLIDVERQIAVDERAELTFLRGLRWAEPSIDHLIALLRRVVERPQEMEAIGQRARQDMVDYWQWPLVAAVAADRLRAIEAELAHRPAVSPQSVVDSLSIHWEGGLFTHTSLGLINRELGLHLLDAGCQIAFHPTEPDHFDPQLDPRFLRLVKSVRAPLDRPNIVHVRHHWPPNLIPPSEGHWVMIQPWEYGSLPKEWVPIINEQVDEVWVYSTFVQDCFVRSGVDPQRVHVVPCGVDVHKFHPRARPAPLPTNKRFKFLFVGATIWRKGSDLLLDAYLSQFTADDDVCLVIKDLPGYPGRFVTDRIRQVQADPEAPEILYLADALPPDDLPGLYTACDCLVLPYRGEGFGLPILEAMACGRPVIVTNYGAALDFCTPQNAYLIPASVVWMPERRVAHLETVDYPYLAEPDVEHLGRLLRQVYERPQEALTIGRRAAEHVHRYFTWEKAAEKAMARLEAIVRRPIRRQQRAYYEFTEKSISLIGQGKLAEAEALLRVGVTRYPQDPDLLCNLAELTRVRGSLAETSDLFQRALALEPNNVGALLGTAELALDRGDPARARHFYAQARAAYPELAKTLDPIIAYLEKSAPPANEPSTHTDSSPATAPDSALDIADLPQMSDDPLAPGRAALERGDLPAAVRAFTEVTTHYPDLAAGHVALAMALLALDCPAEAIAPLRRALVLEPTATTFNQLGVALYQTGDLDGAAAAFTDAQHADPNDVAAHLNLIDLHRARGQYAPATEAVKEALRRWPDHADVLATFGILCVELGDAEGAQIALKRLQDVAPDHAAVAALSQALA